MAKTLLIFALSLSCVALADPSASRSPSPSPEPSPSFSTLAVKGIPLILAQVEKNYAKAGTLLADFDQVNESAAMHTKKSSSGDIAIKKPNKLRWQTLRPDPNILVSDGKHAWYYTPPFDSSEHGQYSEFPAKQIQSKLANALLSGDFTTLRGVKIELSGPSEFHLRPKAGTAGSVTDAWIEIDREKKLITHVRLLHDDGNRSDIQLSKIRLGEKLGDSIFVFKAPPGTDKIDN